MTVPQRTVEHWTCTCTMGSSRKLWASLRLSLICRTRLRNHGGEDVLHIQRHRLPEID
jgi:hypothetical protein